MIETTITLSTKGQLPLPKTIREADNLEASDVFRLQRVAPGKYVLEKMAPPKLARARLVRSRDGFLVFHAGKKAQRITGELVKQLEAESI